MQTSTHTPMRHTEGPWYVEDHHILGGTPQERIAFEVNHIGNARLIAAAPALLDALRAALPLLMLTAIQSLATDIDKHDRYAQTADVVRAAIAAATGEDV